MARLPFTWAFHEVWSGLGLHVSLQPYSAPGHGAIISGTESRVSPPMPNWCSAAERHPIRVWPELLQSGQLAAAIAVAATDPDRAGNRSLAWLLLVASNGIGDGRG